MLASTIIYHALSRSTLKNVGHNKSASGPLCIRSEVITQTINNYFGGAKQFVVSTSTLLRKVFLVSFPTARPNTVNDFY